MEKMHEKSGCSHSRTRRFGKRRRQCTVCGTTWSVWKKRRGRARIRVSAAPARAFIEHCGKPIRKRSCSRNRAQYRLARSLRTLIASEPYAVVPRETPLILVADALVKYMSGQWHTWYVFLVRPIASTDALILPHYHRVGTETGVGWEEAFRSLPDSVQKSIVALVCDGHQGLLAGARRRKWLVQRCHFHLLLRLRGQRSRGRTGRNRAEAADLYTAVTTVLTTTNARTLSQALHTVLMLHDATSSRIVRTALSGFLKNHADYRTYLTHPHLNLPTTSNTAETYVGLIEEMNRRARGFRTVAQLDAWITAMAKVRKTIRCAPKYQQN